METCIYCGSSGPFEKEEHIVCASLGGTKRLPRDFVCLNCNGLIFPYIEKKFIESFIAQDPSPYNRTAELARIGLGQISDEDAVERIIARMIFNFIALVTERQVLYHGAFDDIKDLILNGVKESRVSIFSDKKAEWYKKYVRDAGFPLKGHYISVNSWEDKLYGSVGLFGGNQIYNVRIAEVVPFYSINESMFICDWINQKDYTLSEFLSTANLNFI